MLEKITSRNHDQNNEMLLRLIVYNACRIIKIEYVIWIWFLQGQFQRILIWQRVACHSIWQLLL